MKKLFQPSESAVKKPVAAEKIKNPVITVVCKTRPKADFQPGGGGLFLAIPMPLTGAGAKAELALN